VIALVVALLLAQDAGTPLSVAQPAIVVRAGDVVAFDGVLMSDAKAVEVGKRLASAEAVVAALKEQPVVGVPAILTAGGVVLSAFASAFGAGYEARALQR